MRVYYLLVVLTFCISKAFLCDKVRQCAFICHVKNVSSYHESKIPFFIMLSFIFSLATVKMLLN